MRAEARARERRREMILIFDVETTGLPDRSARVGSIDGWPRIVSLAWQIGTESGFLSHGGQALIQPDGYIIPNGAAAINGITQERAIQHGFPIRQVLTDFLRDAAGVKMIVCHNVRFDIGCVVAECRRLREDNGAQELMGIPTFCTMNNGIEIAKKPGDRWPSLTELHLALFGEPYANPHTASADVKATARCYFEMTGRTSEAGGMEMSHSIRQPCG